LSESRLAVAEERLDIELQLGLHHRAIVELEQLVATHPLREGLRGLLMLALYRAGRQADALRIFQEGRELLGEELGLEPGPELRRLESAILTHDPTLAAPESAAPAPRPIATVGSAGIPEALTPLVGRDAEVRDLKALLGIKDPAAWFARGLPALRAVVRPIYVRLGILPEVATGLNTAAEASVPPERG
jgi:hypothetical protein